ncbi:Hypothetical protein A7982_00924 [Minicystis rosea]|nr:Hypothetical protein A7982_00924 [Minicystis rosea]
MRSLHAAIGAGLLVLLAGCEKPKHYTTTVEVTKIRRFGQDPKVPGVTEMELKFAECPGEAIKVLRADKSFSECGSKLKRGDKVPAEVVLSYSRERSSYRNDIVRIDDCAVKVDPKDEANYELVQQCRDLVATGMEVGVHCDRTRSPELLAKCPWLRRR